MGPENLGVTPRFGSPLQLVSMLLGFGRNHHTTQPRGSPCSRGFSSPNQGFNLSPGFPRKPKLRETGAIGGFCGVDMRHSRLMFIYVWNQTDRPLLGVGRA